MDNKLFLVCPFCRMEPFIRKNYGQTLFLSAPAAVFHFSDDELTELKSFVEREHIRDLYLVSDESCHFIRRALNHEPPAGLSCESFISHLITEDDTPSSVSAKIVKRQLDAADHPESWVHVAVLSGLRIHGVVTSVKNQTLTTLITYQ